MDIFHWIAYFNVFSVCIPLILALIQWNRIPRDISSLRWLPIASLIFDLVMIKLSSLSIHNQWVGDIYMFIQCIVLLYIFSLQYTHKILFRIAGLIIVLLYVTSFLFPKHSIAVLVRSGTVDSLVLIVISVAFFYKLLNELKVAHIHRLPILWISFATLFYYSGNLFVFLATSALEEYPDSYILTWMFHNILNVTKNILFAIALWQSYRTVRTQHG